jgi:hypothetical protein
MITFSVGTDTMMAGLLRFVTLLIGLMIWTGMVSGLRLRYMPPVSGCPVMPLSLLTMVIT